MAKDPEINSIQTRYSTERRLLAQYNEIMARRYQTEIQLKEAVHNANFTALNPYLLKAFEITPNPVGYNEYYYTWDPIGTDRRSINLEIHISKANRESTRLMTHFANTSAMFTLNLRCNQHFEHKYGARLYLVYLEFKHFRHTYQKRRRHQYLAKIRWLDDHHELPF